MKNSCNSCNNSQTWILKLSLLLLMLIIFSISIIYYYKSLNNMKHRELDGR